MSLVETDAATTVGAATARAPRPARASLGYLICTSPRTGSTLLADGLKAFGHAGQPDEYFDVHPENERHWVERLGIGRDAEYFEKIMAAATTTNGVCSLKLHWHQIEVFRAKLATASGHARGNVADASLADLIRENFGEVRYLWLRRRNKVAQGVSYYRASATGEWRRYREAAAAAVPEPKPAEFDYAEIDRLVRLCAGFDQQWENFFRRNRLRPLVLVYEELVKAYEPTLRGVLRFLGLPDVAGPLVAPRLERQADARSLQWERQYRVRREVEPAAATVGNGTAAAIHRSIPERADAAATNIPPWRTYLICTGPRTGSTRLCDALSSSGLAGKPDEYFAMGFPHLEVFMMRRLKAWGEAEYVDRVIERATTSNGVFGVKVHWPQVEPFRQKLITALAPRFPGAGEATFERLLREKFGGPRYIWLRRRNKVAQGISYYRAQNTGVWRAVPGRGDQANVADKELEFDFAGIDRCVRAVQEYDWRWQEYLATHRLAPLMVSYEELVEDLDLTVRGILKFLEIPHEAARIVQPDLERQADERSLEWERRYLDIVTERTSVAMPAAPTENRGLAVRPAAAAPADAMPEVEARGHAPPKPSVGEGTRDALIAYVVNPANRLPLVVAPVARDWMDATPNRFAYRCLPMLIANQAGWLILNGQKLAVQWDGGAGLDALTIEHFGTPSPHAKSHFGSGILTFTLPYLFRTRTGCNLHVRGPANWPKDGIAALEGIVETDWSEATFTMNWKLTRPNHIVVFEEGDPIAMIVPQRRGELETFRPEIRDLGAEPELRDGYARWSRSRTEFNSGLQQADSPSRKSDWQRHYMRGISIDLEPAPEHQSRLVLQEFADRTKEPGA